MNLEALQVFVATVEHGSFAGAASALAMSRATVAKRVDELEAETGVPLLVRSASGVVPTSAGIEIAESGRAVIGQAKALLGSARRMGRSPAGVVRMVAEVGMPVEPLMHVAGLLERNYPDLRFDLRFHEDPLQVLLGQADMATTLAVDIPEGPWDVVEMLPSPETLVATEAYLAEHGAPQSLEDLASHALVAWRRAGELWQGLPLWSGGYHDVELQMATNHVDMLMQWVRAGKGLGLLPYASLAPVVRRAPVVPVLSEVVGRARAPRTVFPRGVLRMPRVQVFFDEMRVWTERIAEMGRQAAPRPSSPRDR